MKHLARLRRAARPVVRLFRRRDKQKYFVSFPKSGRTWVRMFLNHYYFYVYPFCVVGRKQRIYDETIPCIKFSHGGHDDFGKSSMSDIERTASESAGVPCIVLIRDPRDVLISYFFHLTKRLQESGMQNNISALDDIIRHETLGFKRIVEFTNVWYSFASENDNGLVVYYETIKENPEREFVRILNFLGETDVNVSSLRKAMESTSFDRMKEAERESQSKLPYLTSRDLDDENSFKVREGKVGGFASYVSGVQKQVLEEEMNRLHPVLRSMYLEPGNVSHPWRQIATER